jgi:hypothetical protein
MTRHVMKRESILTLGSNVLGESMEIEIKMAGGVIETVKTDKNLQELIKGPVSARFWIFTDLKGREIMININNILSMRKK